VNYERPAAAGSTDRSEKFSGHMSLAMSFPSNLQLSTRSIAKGGTTQARYTPFLAEHRQHQDRNNTPYALKL